MRKTYERPTMEAIGSFETVTKAGGGSTRLDSDFDSDTLSTDLTFS